MCLVIGMGFPNLRLRHLCCGSIVGMTNTQKGAETARRIIRCYIYARVAQSKPMALERQILDGHALAEKLSTLDSEYQVVRVFQDDGSSGYSGPRPGFEEMLAGLKRGEASVVLVWSEDRLYRNPATQQAYSELSKRLAITTYSTQAGRIG
jgi:DNA invertase Pin-like site-specific DNA recombinase